MSEVVTSASQAAGADARYAHPGFEVCDSEFAAALGPAPRLALVAATDAHEGPVYIPGEDVLYFTSLPGKVDIPAPGTPGAYVKRLALDGLNFPVDPSRLSVVPAPVHMPNGMALSPGEQTLYNTDSGANQEPGSYHVQRPHRIVAFDVQGGSHLGPGRLFAVTTPGFPDGIKVDLAARVYASAAGGVQVFSPA